MPPPLKRSRLVRHAHLLVHGQAGVGSHEQRVFLGAVHGHVVFAAHAGVDELDDDFLPDAFEVAIAPVFKREGRSLAAALFHGTLVRCRRKDATRFRPAGRT